MNSVSFIYSAALLALCDQSNIVLQCTTIIAVAFSTQMKQEGKLDKTQLQLKRNNVEEKKGYIVSITKTAATFD